MARPSRKKKHPWEQYPELPEAPSGIDKATLFKLQARKRHKNARYLLFRLRTLTEKGAPIPDRFFDDGLELPLGFVEHFLTAPITRIQLPNGERAMIVDGRIRTPSEIGGLLMFAARWDVDPDLQVYSRHRSIHAEWNSVLERVVPVLGEE